VALTDGRKKGHNVLLQPHAHPSILFGSESLRTVLKSGKSGLGFPTRRGGAASSLMIALDARTTPSLGQLLKSPPAKIGSPLKLKGFDQNADGGASGVVGQKKKLSQSVRGGDRTQDRKERV